MTDKPQINSCYPPTVCADCMERILTLAAEADDATTQTINHCPHGNTAVHLTLDYVSGERAIIKYLLEAPCSERRFVQLAEGLADSLGAEMGVLNKETLQ